MTVDCGVITDEVIDVLDEKWIDWQRVIVHANDEHAGLVGTSLYCLYADGDNNLIPTNISNLVDLPEGVEER